MKKLVVLLVIIFMYGYGCASTSINAQDVITDDNLETIEVCVKEKGILNMSDDSLKYYIVSDAARHGIETNISRFIKGLGGELRLNKKIYGRATAFVTNEGAIIFSVVSCYNNQPKVYYFK